MRIFPILIAIGAVLTAPVHAQIHEAGAARAGAVLDTRMSGTALMCRLACSQRGDCTGWSWARPGATGPLSRCELLGGAIRSQPDNCCESGQNALLPAPPAASVQGENRYAGRSTAPTGQPVALITDPTGGIWNDTPRDGLMEDEEENEGEDGNDTGETRIAAEEEDDARFAERNDAETPTVTVGAGDDAASPAPAARIAPQRRAGNGPALYSVLREYAAPAAPIPLGPGIPQ